MSNLFDKNILVIGESGQIGSNLIDILKQKRIEFHSLNRSDLDLSFPEKVVPCLKSLQIKPDVIINASAYTAVDNAEDERELCLKINYESVQQIAKYCKDKAILLIHYSTDYAFNGGGDSAFLDEDASSYNPQNFYGESKLSGDLAIQESGCDYLIFRVSWVYNHKGKNFLLTMLNLFEKMEKLRMIDDQYGFPCYAYDIAYNTVKILEKVSVESEVTSGIYNMVGDEVLSWYDFANLILDEAKYRKYDFIVKNIEPISTSEYPTRAKRPLNSRLSNQKLYHAYKMKMPKVASSLKKCFDKIQ
jgi:dTDP-4-dehydrorhamnose reductase